ncbi:MAG: hypothetical protein ACFE8P_16620 [Promethearchaeota archaeon]
MKIKNWREWAFKFMLIACIQWFILSTLAMIFYAGGTYINHNAPGYSFWANFFSDAGRTKGYNGNPNIASCILWNTALSIFSVSLIFFAIAFQGFFTKAKTEKYLSILGSISGVFAGIFFIGLALTPWDIYTIVHLMLYIPAFLFSFLMAFFYTIVILLNKSYPNRYALIFLAFTIILAVYLIFFFFRLSIEPFRVSIETTEGLTMYATTQKIVAYVSFISILIEGYGAWKFEKT